MQHRRPILLAATSALVVLAVACRTPERAQPPLPSAYGVTLRMTEVARDGEFPLGAADRFRRVDLNSVLRLDFDVPPAPEGVTTSLAWKDLTQDLTAVKNCAAGYMALFERAAELEGVLVQDAEFVNAAQAAQDEIVQVLRLAVRRGQVTPDELTELMIDEGDMQPSFEALALDLDRERALLQARARRYAEASRQMAVVVRAFLLPRSGGRQALHVPGWDNLPEGDFRPQDPLALFPTAEEARRLRGELDAARAVAEAIDEIRANRRAILAEFRRLASNLSADLSGAVQDLRAGLDDLDGSELLNALDALGTQESVALAMELRALRDDLAELRAYGEELAGLRDELEGLLQSEAAPISAFESLFTRLQAALELADENALRLAGLPARIQSAGELIPPVLAAGVEAALGTALRQLRDEALVELRLSALRLARFLPATLEALGRLLQLQGGAAFAAGVAPLEAGSDPYLPRLLENLQAAELDLRRSGAVTGDLVEIQVDLRPTNSSEPADRTHVATYRAETTFAGWHRRYSADVIFSRTTQGPDSDQFRSSAAVSLEWHHYGRAEPASFLNWLDPGLGLHAAFLNQDVDQNVELGGGVNTSLWDGLVRVGLGYNVTADDDNVYWFFGFGLFSALGQLRDLGTNALSLP